MSKNWRIFVSVRQWFTLCSIKLFAVLIVTVNNALSPVSITPLFKRTFIPYYLLFTSFYTLLPSIHASFHPHLPWQSTLSSCYFDSRRVTALKPQPLSLSQFALPSDYRCLPNTSHPIHIKQNFPPPSYIILPLLIYPLNWYLFRVAFFGCSD